MQLRKARVERSQLVAGSTHLCAKRGEGRRELPHRGLPGGELKCGDGSSGSGGRAVFFLGGGRRPGVGGGGLLMGGA